jgi:hypothetical protein
MRCSRSVKVLASSFLFLRENVANFLNVRKAWQKNEKTILEITRKGGPFSGNTSHVFRFDPPLHEM